MEEIAADVEARVRVCCKAKPSLALMSPSQASQKTPKLTLQYGMSLSTNLAVFKQSSKGGEVEPIFKKI